jgi:hypothetical protein
MKLDNAFGFSINNEHFYDSSTTPGHSMSNLPLPRVNESILQPYFGKNR